MKNNFVGGKEASQILGVHQRTLYMWEKKGIIDTIRTKENGKRFYNVNKYLQQHGQKCVELPDKTMKCSKFEDLDKKERIKLCYARVSSHGQKNDLERQKELLKNKFPNYELIEDIGSGINMSRRGLLKIIDLAIEGKIKKIVIVHKDRLTRFGFEMIEYIIKKYSNGKIIILESNDTLEPEEELAKDVLQIMNVFVAKMNGRRKYKHKDKQ
jgi:predicted site-specific integrase-resolvase